MTIGRDWTNDIVIRDPAVSQRSDASTALVDLESTDFLLVFLVQWRHKWASKLVELNPDYT